MTARNVTSETVHTCPNCRQRAMLQYHLGIDPVLYPNAHRLASDMKAKRKLGRLIIQLLEDYAKN